MRTKIFSVAQGEIMSATYPPPGLWCINAQDRQLRRTGRGRPRNWGPRASSRWSVAVGNRVAPVPPLRSVRAL